MSRDWAGHPRPLVPGRGSQRVGPGVYVLGRMSQDVGPRTLAPARVRTNVGPSAYFTCVGSTAYFTCVDISLDHSTRRRHRMPRVKSTVTTRSIDDSLIRSAMHGQSRLAAHGMLLTWSLMPITRLVTYRVLLTNTIREAM